MDVTFDLGKDLFNYRVAAVIEHNGKILLHKNKKDPYYALLGGRVKVGEDSRSALKREIMEEMGKEINIISDFGIIENFFDKNKKYHELAFIYRVEFVKQEDQMIEETILNIEGETDLQYEWVEVNNIDNINVKPIIFKSILKAKEFPVHCINNDFTESFKIYR